MADDAASPVLIAALAPDPIDVAGHVAAVAGPDAGALATFLGTVRDHSPDADGEVVELHYSAHPDAGATLTGIAARIAAAHPGTRLAVSHRTGELRVGEVAIAVVVASAHRAAAFGACRALVEAVKAELPVWKKQVLADGSHTWVGSA